MSLEDLRQRLPIIHRFWPHTRAKRVFLEACSRRHPKAAGQCWQTSKSRRLRAREEHELAALAAKSTSFVTPYSQSSCSDVGLPFFPTPARPMRCIHQMTSYFTVLETELGTTLHSKAQKNRTHARKVSAGRPRRSRPAVRNYRTSTRQIRAVRWWLPTPLPILVPVTTQRSR